MSFHTRIVICGAGIAGISTAYHLLVNHGESDIILIDELPPLSLTSDKSTECYRNWWPGPGNTMVALMNRSIDLLDNLAIATGNVFHMNRRGYLYLTGKPEKIPEIEKAALESSALGAGQLRKHRGISTDSAYLPSDAEGFQRDLTGADFILEPKLLRTHFPFLSESIVGALHIRRAGWFSAQQLGRYLLDYVRTRGIQLIQSRVTAIDRSNQNSLTVRLNDGSKIITKHFVNAAGPYLKQVGKMVGVDLPVFCELHLKAAIKDHLTVVPRDAPLLIWMDSQELDWSTEDRSMLEEDPQNHWMLEEFPPGAHTRPEGPPDSPILLLLWEYHSNRVDPVFPPPFDYDYPEIALRGLLRMIPGLKEYLTRLPKPVIDGGYYTKTRENRPLIGPLPLEGTWVVGALSGYGLMAAMAAGELLSQHITGSALPDYANELSLDRYKDPKYLKLLNNWGDSGQL
jgi:glycine/D-amino acid oxidase-like deaminating enzyme